MEMLVETQAHQTKKIEFQEIQSIWKEQLWPQRQSPIEPVSWIDPNGRIDPNLDLGSPTFWGCFLDGGIVGVCSGFRTCQTSYRSRGLWVHPEFRRKKLGSLLIHQVAEQALSQGCQTLWTMPRHSAWEFYRKNDFIETASVNHYEFGPHLLAMKKLVLWTEGPERNPKYLR